MAKIIHVGDVVIIYSPYDPQLVTEIRGIPGRKYNGDLKVWSVPAEYEEYVRAMVRSYFPLEDEQNIAIEGVPEPSGPFAVLKLEYIAENYHAYKRQAKITHEPTERYKEYLGHNQSRPWVKKVTGQGPRGGLLSEFVHGQIDYSQANSTGSRGIYLYFYLREGVYEVNERTSWKSVRKYFCQVEGIEIREITREEVEKWLSKD